MAWNVNVAVEGRDRFTYKVQKKMCDESVYFINSQQKLGQVHQCSQVPFTAALKHQE